MVHVYTDGSSIREGEFDDERGRRDYCKDNKAWSKSEGMK